MGEEFGVENLTVKHQGGFVGLSVASVDRLLATLREDLELEREELAAETERKAKRDAARLARERKAREQG